MLMMAATDPASASGAAHATAYGVLAVMLVAICYFLWPLALLIKVIRRSNPNMNDLDVPLLAGTFFVFVCSETFRLVSDPPYTAAGFLTSVSFLIFIGTVSSGISEKWNIKLRPVFKFLLVFLIGFFLPIVGPFFLWEITKGRR